MFPVDTFKKTLVKFVTILARHEIRFHLTGGLTGAAYGEPRMTQDIDLVVDPDQTSRVVDDFLKSLAESDFMFDEPSVREAVKHGGMFQLLDKREVLKLDIYPRELIEGELSRSESMEIFEASCFLWFVESTPQHPSLSGSARAATSAAATSAQFIAARTGSSKPISPASQKSSA